MSGLHSAQGVGEIHIPYQWSYADEAARTGASGFVFGDVGKLARQLDDNSLWMLTATTPTWLQVGGGGSDTDAIHKSISGEIASLTEKATPADADLVVIEDSAASNAKKKVQIQNITGGATIPTIIQDSEDAEDTTTSTSYVQACRFSPTLEAAKYLVWYSFEFFQEYPSDAYKTQARIQIDDTTTIAEVESPGSDESYEPAAGIYFFDNSGGSGGTFNFDFDFRSTASFQDAKIRRKRLALMKVSE